ncbi:Glucitol operon activator protein (GutM) [Salinibacillus kushneri]|uniref:Glucitol operon activator protein (GutM) n=1 Tax=Salinibacillus kushneri TaxID=237682 RepID=A0A1H9ZEV6_9BACI|nr:transcriptional regulator GutM [Salinibacillus kushneri]SES79582.1 Glucitol operon activator protein (GutM) [Salinibacillus kushneri]
MGLVLIACGLLITQYALTFIQVRHYKNSMEAMIGKYKGTKGIHLFSGKAQRKLGAGSIAMIVVDENYIIKECQAVHGVSILSTFKEIKQYKGSHVGELLDSLHASIQATGKYKRKRVPALSVALHQAAENALISISKKSQD